MDHRLLAPEGDPAPESTATPVSAMQPSAKDMADRLKLQAGDKVIAIETDRGILLTPYDPETEEALSIAAEVGRT